MKLSSIFGAGRGGLTGVVVTAWKHTRFGTPPVETSEPPSGTPTASVTTSATEFGCPGAWYVSVTTTTTYWVSAVFAGKRYWSLYPATGGTTKVTMDGDVTGTSTDNTVTGIQGRFVRSTEPTGSQVLAWITEGDPAVSGWTPTSLATLLAEGTHVTITTDGDGYAVINATTHPTGSASGDLSGTYPDPTVKAIQGHAVKTAEPTTGQVLKWVTATSEYVPSTVTTSKVTMDGDVTGTSTAAVVAKAPSGSVVAGSGITITTTSGKAKLASTTIPIVAKTTSWTAALTTAGSLVTLSNASGKTATLPKHATVAWPIGTVISFMSIGAGQLTVAAGATVTLHTPATYTPKTRVEYSQITATCIATNVWVMSGDLAA